MENLENLKPDPAKGYVVGSFVITCQNTNREPFVVCGNLAYHDAISWLARYRAMYPKASKFTLHREGGAQIAEAA